MKTYEYKTIKYNEYEDNDCIKDTYFQNSLEYYLEKQETKGALRLRRNDFCTTSYVGVIKYKDFHLDIFPKLLAPKKTKDKDNQDINANQQCEEKQENTQETDNSEIVDDDNSTDETTEEESEELTKTESETLEKEEITNQIIKNLLYMISLTEKLDIKITEYANISNCENPFLEVLIREYAVSLFECLKRLTPRNYVREEDNLNYLKGKLKFTENIRYNCANQAKFYCEYDEFSENNKLNKLFLYVSKCLFTISKNSENKKVLSFIMNYFCDLPFEKTDRYKAEKIILTRNQKLFEHPFKLAKMFLNHLSVDISKNSIENITLLWDMNKLFEEFVYEVLNRGCNKYEPQEQKQKKLLRNADGRRKKGNSYVDIYIERKFDDKIQKIVLDTKYKLDTLKDNADIYQICTYCLLHDTDHSVLIYPKDIGKEYSKEFDEINKGKDFFTQDKEYQLNTDDKVGDIFINRIYVDLSNENLENIIGYVHEFEDILDNILIKHEMKKLLKEYEINNIEPKKKPENQEKEELQKKLCEIIQKNTQTDKTGEISDKIKNVLNKYEIKKQPENNNKPPKTLIQEIMDVIKK